MDRERPAGLRLPLLLAHPGVRADHAATSRGASSGTAATCGPSLTTIALPYLIFEPALFYFRAGLGQHESGPVLLVPHWAMWYLPVIFVWRLAAPVLKRHWLWIPASVVISLVGGLTTVPYLCLPRILGLLPFFVLGLHLDKAKLDLLRFWWLRPVAVAALVWIFIFAGHIDDWARTAFLLYDAGYPTWTGRRRTPCGSG